MPRDGAIIFGDLVGKLDVLKVACGKCGREGRYAVVAHFVVSIFCVSVAVGAGSLAVCLACSIY
jgi:hypothetical protein